MTRSTKRDTKRAAVYCRISRDREGAGLGVDRQESDCRALAERLGFEVVTVYVDNDISASAKSRKPRPQYEEMMRQAKGGALDAILSYSNSRLTRRPREFEDLIDLNEQYGVEFHTVVSGSFDLATADGRRMARFLAGEATAEAERTSERARRAKAEMAKNGEWRGGPRPFGYHKGGMKVKESEAAIIREMTSELLAGRSLRALVKELNERRVPTPQRTTKWSNRTLKQVIVRPRNAALISTGPADRHGMEILPGKAKWEPIIDEETFHAVRDLLMAPSRRSSFTTEVSHLGSGLYVCGREDCGQVLRPGLLPRRKGDDPTRRRFQYRCAEGLHLTITEKPTDKHVREVVAEVVRDPRIVKALSADTDEATAALLQADRERRAVVVASQQRTERDYDGDLIDGHRYKAKMAKLTDELAEIDARLADGVRRSTANPIAHAPDPGKAFLDAPLDVQRSVLAAVVRVEILPSGPGVKWSTDRIRITPVV